MKLLYTKQNDKLKLLVQLNNRKECFVIYTRLQKLNSESVYFYKIYTIMIKKYDKHFNEFENCSSNPILLNSIIQYNIRYLQYWRENRDTDPIQKNKWNEFIRKNTPMINKVIRNSGHHLQKIKNQSLKKILLYIELWSSLGYVLHDIPYYNKEDTDIRMVLMGTLLLLEYKNKDKRKSVYDDFFYNEVNKVNNKENATSVIH